MKFKTLFSVPSGNLYAGEPEGDMKFSGIQVKSGKLRGQMRRGMYGYPVAYLIEPMDGSNGDELPRDIEIHLKGNPFQSLLLGQFLDHEEG